MSIVLREESGRGFLSNYNTILCAYKRFVGKEGKSYKDIHISTEHFKMYGRNPRAWFDVYSISDGDQNSEHWSTGVLNDIEEYPTVESLNLASYSCFMPYNKRVKQFLTKNIRPLNKCLGVHYRGTDHHQGIITPDVMLFNVGEQLQTGKFKQIFICSEQQTLIDLIADFVETHFVGIKIITNDVLRCDSTPIFYLDVDKVALGDQVLLDAHMLSCCDFVLGKTSNVISYSRILNLKLDGYYLDLQKYFLTGN
jgi:hypothetical protein